MNEVQVNIVDSKISHRLLAGRLDMLWAMESVPKFRNNEKVLSFADAFVEGSFDSLACLFFVAIVCGRVEHSIASFDGAIDNVSAYVTWHFPETKTDLG